MEAESGAMWPQAKECWQPPEAGRCKEWISQRASKEEYSPANTLILAQWNEIQTFDFQNYANKLPSF